MKRLFAVLAAVPLFAAGELPNRYIVELSTEPVAAHVGTRSLLHSQAAERRRAAIRAEQAAARTRIEAFHGHVLGSVSNVKNALMVEIPDAEAAQLAAIPGVRRVFREREFRMTLDRALPLLHVPEAWSQVGVANAGAGIRIGMIDSGIDVAHPGFADAAFTAPAGFPLANVFADLAFTNNKVIVARSYASLFPVPDPDTSARDDQGHGTATAMTAAGVANTGPLAVISGVAPRAFLGSYKVFGTPGVNDTTSTGAILSALDDAVGDGMDIVNISLGSNLAMVESADAEVQAVEQAAALGVIVVVSAGNNGPDPATIASPADAPSAISVGATNNDRLFSAVVNTSGGASFQAAPAAGAGTPAPITAPLLDVAAIDGTGQACAALPPNSLAGAIALIFRGNCTFESKLNNAQAAGAVGGLVYDNVVESPLVVMATGTAKLPAEMLSQQDGLALKAQISSGFTATLGFTLQPFYTDPAQLAAFSAKGPNQDFAIKPDLVAVGENLYTAAVTANANGLVYDPSGYELVQGTSFSGPLVSGAAAVLKQARPGLTAAQYRSLLIDTAAPASLVPGASARVQQAGAGLLNLLAALNATAAASPVSMSFGAGGDFSVARILTITNVGAAADQFQLGVAPRDGSGPVPSPAVSSVQLDPGASASIPVTFAGSGLSPGEYEGFLTVQGAQSSTGAAIPYWYGVPSGVPAHVTVLYNASGGGPVAVNTRIAEAVVFRVSDASGLPVSGALPEATSVSGGGAVTGIGRYGPVPDAFVLGVRTGTSPGANVFQIQAGALAVQVTILCQ